MYDGSAFYKVSENTFVQAGDIEYGNINKIFSDFDALIALIIKYFRLF